MPANGRCVATPCGESSGGNPGSIAARLLVARCGDGLRPRSGTDRVDLHRLRGCRRTLDVIAVESNVAAIFVVVATAAVTGSAWLLVLGLAGHGLKDLRQHRTQFVANTRWWPPFCLVIDWVAAAIIAVEIAVGVDFRG